MLACIDNYAGESSCTRGFPSSLIECRDHECYYRTESAVTRIIPQMMFTCNGTLVKWRAAGEFHTSINLKKKLFGGDDYVNTILNIWRKKSTESGVYDKVGTIELGICGSGVDASPVTGLNSVYECTLLESSRVSVQTGDIIGVEVADENKLRFRVLYHHAASGTRSYHFTWTASAWQDSSSIRLGDGCVISPADEPQISLIVEPTMANPTTTTIPTIAPVPTSATTICTTQSPTTFTLQTLTPFKYTVVIGDSHSAHTTAIIIAGAAAGGIVLTVLYIVIILLVIKRCKMMLNKGRKIGTRDGRTEQDSQVDTTKEMETDIKYHAARIVIKDSTNGQQANNDKTAPQYAGQYYRTGNQCEQVPSQKLWCKKGTAPVISGNHSASHGSYTSPRYEQVPSEKLRYKKGAAPTIISNQSASHSLYTSPKIADSGRELRVQNVNGARYETASGYERAAVYEKAGVYEIAAVYEQAAVYQKAAVYEQAAVYEKATTYEKVAMYEQAATYERAITYEKAPPSNVQC